MRRVVVLSAYAYAWEAPESTTTCRDFVRALAAAGWRNGLEVEIEIHHAGPRAAHAAFLERRLERPLDLVYAGSASLMETARAALGAAGRDDVPLVYWGSHIVDQGRAINPEPREPFIAGLRLEMPLYTHHRQFRLLRALFPELEAIYCPFSVDSVFYHREMRERHARAVERSGPACWIDAASGGFPGLGQLAEILGARFYEHPLASVGALVEAVEALPPGDPGGRHRAILMNGIECFHLPGANEALVEVADRRGIPYVGLNFGGFHGPRGPLALFSNDIDSAAHACGEIAAQLLAGAEPASIGIRPHDCFRFVYNMENAVRRSCDLSPAARRAIGRYFTPFGATREPRDGRSPAHHHEPLQLDPEDPARAGRPQGRHL